MNIHELYDIYLQQGALTTDSRNCPKGSIFLALKGASFDGNKFAAKALESGCSYAVVDEAEYADASDKRYIIVDDCLTTYKELAREHRRHFQIPVIGITGTNGKTTTKELVSAVLAEKYNVMHTQANYNNDVGVPRTLLTLNKDHEIAVVEMGASHPGDIKKLVEYVEPTCGLITNVGRAHLQGFGSFEGVKRTKGELYDFLKAHDGLVFINGGNKDLVSMAQERNINNVVEYGQDGNFSVSGHIVACDPFLRFTWHCSNEATEHTVSTRLIGSYNIDNMLAAVAVGLHFGVSADNVCHALEQYRPTNDRSELMQTQKNHLVVDAYNANPSSMAAALDNFRLMQVPHKMAILGDMRELGSASEAEHQRVVDMLKTLNLDDVWLVGPEFAKTDCGFRKFSDVKEVEEEIEKHCPEGKYILIKGSNGIRLFELPDKL